MGKINIGVLGTAKITQRAIIEPAKALDNVCIFGVASRELEKANKFAQVHGIPHVFPDYESLLCCNLIDAVYIPLPNSLHTPWIIRTALAKKHILIEKPICLRTEEFDAIENAVTKSGIYLLEAVMTQHHPWQKRISEIIKTGIYGNLQSIKTRFTFQFAEEDNYRFSPEKGGGVFFDVGTYWVQFIQSCVGLHPKSIRGRSDFRGPNGIDLTFEAWMDFQDGIRTEFLCSFERSFEASHWLKFKKTEIGIRNFLRPTIGKQMISIEIHHLGNNKRQQISFIPENYYCNQLNFFLRVIKGKEKSFPLVRSGERVRIMEDIYNAAKKEFVKEKDKTMSNHD